jgi:hypothetical protein
MKRSSKRAMRGLDETRRRSVRGKELEKFACAVVDLFPSRYPSVLISSANRERAIEEQDAPKAVRFATEPNTGTSKASTARMAINNEVKSLETARRKGVKTGGMKIDVGESMGGGRKRRREELIYEGGL